MGTILYHPHEIKILDNLPTASMAFSFRKLRSAYNGYCIRAIRTDAVEQDIGFFKNNIDTTQLLAFAAAGDGTVHIKTWYDQSGNGINISNTGSGHAQIVNNNTLYYLNGKICALFNTPYGPVNVLLNTLLGSGYENMIFSVKTPYNLVALGETGIVRYGVYDNYSNTIYYDCGNTSGRRISVAIPLGWLSNQVLFSCYSTGATAYIDKNDINLISAAVSGTPNLSTSIPLSIYGTVYTQEIIIFKAYSSDYVTTIKSNINSFYKIY